MTVLQLAMLAGGLVGLGFSMVLLWFSPAHPEAGAALENMAPEKALAAARAAGRNRGPTSPVGWQVRAGTWLMESAPWIGRPRAADLEILQRPVHVYYAEKLGFALLGLVTPVLLNVVLPLVGLRIPVTVPIIVGILLGVLGSFIADYNLRSDADKARADFAAALIPYLDLVALLRHAGFMSRQAMERAAKIGDSYPYRRLGEELARARWSGQHPWEALSVLADQADVPVLTEVSNIMRRAGQQDAAVASTLQARATALRAAATAQERAVLNAKGEGLGAPVALLLALMMVMMMTPFLLRLMGGVVPS